LKRPSLKSMQGFWVKLPAWQRMSPMRQGFWDAAVTILVIALLAWLVEMLISLSPTAPLLDSVAQIGATLLIAYVVEISWLVKASRSRDIEERESRLGAFTGAGAAGLIGIVLSMILSGRAEAHRWIWLDEFCFGWVIASLLMLGITVVMRPMLTHEWMDDEAGQ
jgi:hypothetical protein